MAKPSPKAAGGKVKEPVPLDDRKIDFSKLKPDLRAKDVIKLVGGPGHVVFPSSPIETLSPTKTIGKGRTNLTIIVPTIVQIDRPTPTASFDRRVTPSRNPIIQMHFEPIAYGITSPATYIMEFIIQAFGQSTFNLQGFAGASPVLNTGTKALNGLVGVSLIMQNAAPAQQTFGFLEQTGGVAWDWLSVQVRPPDIVLEP